MGTSQVHQGVKMISATTGNTRPGSFLQKGGVYPAARGRVRTSIQEVVITMVSTSERRSEGEMS